jgi:hypothetical protein
MKSKKNNWQNIIQQVKCKNLDKNYILLDNLKISIAQVCLQLFTVLDAGGSS